MEWIQGILGKIDLTAVIASALTFIAGWAIVKAKLVKAVAVLGEVADLLSAIKTASTDGKYTVEEIQNIAKEGEDIIKEFKK